MPTSWLLNVMLALLIVMPGAETGGCRVPPSSTGSEQEDRGDADARENRRVRASPWLQPRSHKSEFDLERVHSLRGPLLFPSSTRILKQIGSPEARRVSRFVATHRFVEEYMVAARGGPIH